MKIFLVTSLVLLVAQVAKSQEASVAPEIIEIRKSLPMEPTEKAVKDFILNRGSNAGLKAGAYVNVVRDVTVNDPVRNKALGTLHIPVGKLQIIHVENNIAVARLQSELGNEERPTVEYEALMIGDEIDLNTISMEAPKASKKKWSTAAVSPEEKADKEDDSEEVAEAKVDSKTTPPAETHAVPVASAPAPKPLLAKKETFAQAETEKPAFIITPIEEETDVVTKKPTVTAASTAN